MITAHAGPRIEATPSANGEAPERVGAFILTDAHPLLLKTSLRAIMAQTRLPDAVIVINNDGTREVRDAVADAFPEVGVVDVAEHLGSGGGFAGALYLAQQCGFAWSWVMDDDAEPEPGALEAMLRVARRLRASHRPLVLVAPVQFSPHGVFAGARWRHRAVPLSPTRTRGDYFEIDVAYWTGVLVHASAVERVGLPRSDFFNCFADYEFCLRLRRAGLEIVTVPESRIFHQGCVIGDGFPLPARAGRRTPRRLRTEPARPYYAARNAAYTAWHILRSPGAVMFHLLTQARLVAADLLYQEQRLRHVSLRLRGTMDGLRGRLGRRPEYEANEPVRT